MNCKWRRLDLLPAVPLTFLRSRLAALRGDDFMELLSEMDTGLRLLTPMRQAQDPEPSYRLTHSFLVGPIRDWLQQGKLQSLSGRADFRLNERARIWDGRSQRSLPGTIEYCYLALFTDSKAWNPKSRTMMQATKEKLTLRWIFAGFAFLILMPLSTWFGFHLYLENQELNARSPRAGRQ